MLDKEQVLEWESCHG